MPAPRLIARINLDRLQSNWKTLAALSGKAETAAVIKADAYGHGMKAVAQALYHGGCRFFFTASLDEAIKARTFVGEDAAIGFFDNVVDSKDDRDTIHQHRLLPSVNTMHDFTIIAAWSDSLGIPIATMLQIDTGMNRLGCHADDLRAITSQAANTTGGRVDWKLFFSHLIEAEIPQSPRNEAQQRRFDEILSTLPKVNASLAATDGIMLGENYHYNLTRPGIGLYGLTTGPTTTAMQQHIKPVLSLQARVLQISTAQAGETIGYNATATLKRQSRLATIACGYADGFKRELSNKGQAHKDGLSAPVIGRVSMDTTVLDITDWPENHLGIDDYVDLLHDGYTASAMAADCDTISYDVLTALGERVSRYYDGAIIASIDC